MNAYMRWGPLSITRHSPYKKKRKKKKKHQGNWMCHRVRGGQAEWLEDRPRKKRTKLHSTSNWAYLQRNNIYRGTRDERRRQIITNLNSVSGLWNASFMACLLVDLIYEICKRLHSSQFFNKAYIKHCFSLLFFAVYKLKMNVNWLLPLTKWKCI